MGLKQQIGLALAPDLRALLAELDKADESLALVALTSELVGGSVADHELGQARAAVGRAVRLLRYGPVEASCTCGSPSWWERKETRHHYAGCPLAEPWQSEG